MTRSRVNRPGESVFYCADSIDTAVLEMRAKVGEDLTILECAFVNEEVQYHIKSLAKHLAPETRIGRIPTIELVRSRSCEPLILGDIGCLFEIAGERRFKPFDDKGDKIVNVYFPIASRKLLLGTSHSAAFDVDVSDVNEATSKCSYECFVCFELSTANDALSHSNRGLDRHTNQKRNGTIAQRDSCRSRSGLVWGIRRWPNGPEALRVQKSSLSSSSGEAGRGLRHEVGEQDA